MAHQSPPPRELFRRRPEQRLTLLAGLLLTAVLALAHLLHPTLLQALDAQIYDLLLRSGPAAATPDDVVVVDVDDRSLAEQGQWPWPRERIARLLAAVHAGQPRAVGIDFLFAEPDRTDPAGDTALAAELARGPDALGYPFLFDTPAPGTGCELPTLELVERRDPGAPPGLPEVATAAGVACNLPALTEAARSAGFMNVRPDGDGVLRRVPLLIAFGEALYPSLGLATLRTAEGTGQAVLHLGAGGTESLALGPRRIPLDGNGNLLVRFRGPSHTFPYVSAADLLAGTTPPGRLTGRIVLLGTSAAGLQDLRATPFDSVTPGVEVHANIIHNILTGDFIARPPWVRFTELALLVAVGVLATVLLARARALWSLLSLLLGLPLLAGATLLAFRQGIYLSPLYPGLAFFANFTLLTAFKQWREERWLAEKTRELAITQEATIEAIANVAETRDPETGGHIKRTQHYVRLLAEQVRHHPRFRTTLDDGYIDLLFLSAPLHDLGKVGVPDHILLKPGRLTEEEFEVMKLHTVYGKSILEQAEQRLGGNSFLRLATEIAYGHQEKWDGSGYPRGLGGEEIPLSARIMAVADVYDALISTRPYKRPLPHEAALKYIRNGRGRHFDPDLVDAFLASHETFRAIAIHHAEDEEHRQLLSRAPSE